MQIRNFTASANILDPRYKKKKQVKFREVFFLQYLETDIFGCSLGNLHVLSIFHMFPKSEDG
jgi:hypothetical protein